ncbi:protein of unknown function [Methylacidimicrobium sp. AP8]|uniref:hypothetical protein n=1 Tax=Methylacidimicrobium sp. AP8 TaxID=2730359 RepID=UPI0018C04EC3|nr:hypothetical protein [Methylacidimicrobium sp. AP8]CAB4242972.1 protein of unknown function [Methylacidimicrobium sp. AP8]
MSWEQVGALIGAVVATVLIGIGWIALRLKRLYRRLEDMAHDLSETRSDLGNWEKELRTVRTEAQVMRGELQSTRGELQSTRGELQNLRSEMHDHWSTMANVKQVLHRELLDRSNSGGAPTAVAPAPDTSSAAEPSRIPAADLPTGQGKPTASDWLWQETLRRLSG